MTNVEDKRQLDGPQQEGRLTLLLILDGFGLGDITHHGNAITPKTAPNIFRYMDEYQHSELTTYGEAVGLFPGQTGNSEAGHLNIGTGRVVKQDLVHISEEIHNGTFFKNEAFKQALYHVKKYNTAVHIFGLLTDGNSAHAFPEHFHAMLEYLRREGQEKVFIHLFTDGRDSSPHSAPTFLHELRGHMMGQEKIATVMGRFYAMDRNKNWERTKQAFETIVLGKAQAQADSAEEAIAQAYNRGELDEYITPTTVMENGKPVATIQDNDAIFFINARSDRARQLTKAFVQEDFQKRNPGAFRRSKLPKNIRFVAMTDFGPDLPTVFTAFPSPDIDNAIAKAIGEDYRQLYISETEKYAHVTYFLNGGYAEPINGEVRELIHSSDIRSYADQPEMNSADVTKKIIEYIDKKEYNFICANFPNADMVGHTGNMIAAKKAVSIMDGHVKELVDNVLSKDGQVLIVADHGNAEEMINPKTGEMMTEHTTNPVPCILIRKESKGKKKLKNGILADVAPTVLDILGIEKPGEMTGSSLLT